MVVGVAVEQEETMQVTEVHQELLHLQPPHTLLSHSMEDTLPRHHRDTRRARLPMQHPQHMVPPHHSKVAKEHHMVDMDNLPQLKPLPSHLLVVQDTAVMVDSPMAMNRTVITIPVVMVRHQRAVMEVNRAAPTVANPVQTIPPPRHRAIMVGRPHKEAMAVVLPLREIMEVVPPLVVALGDSQDMVVHHPPTEVTRGKVVDTTKVAEEVMGVAGLTAAAVVVIGQEILI